MSSNIEMVAHCRTVMEALVVPEKPESAEFYPITINKDGIVIGHACLYVIKDFEGSTRQHAYVNDVMVSEECRNHGYGTAMMIAVKELAVRLGCRKVVLCTDVSDRAARHFFVKRGYYYQGHEFSMDIDQTAE